MYNNFKEFVTENFTAPKNHSQDSVVYRNWQTKSFQIKLLGMDHARDEVEPQSQMSQTFQDIKKGDMIEVFDMKRKKLMTGRFVSGKKNKDNDYSEVTILDDARKTVRLQPATIVKQ